MRVAHPGRIAVLLLTIALTGCAVETSSAQPPAAHSTSSTAPPIVIRTEAPPITISSEAPTQSREQPTKEKAASQAQSLLDDLQVKGRAPKSGYDRGLFGSAWSDTDHNGCDTRNDILRRDLDVTSYKSGTRDCVVLTGVLDDPYTGESIAFERGQGTSNAVQIDHVIALSDAWQKGAQNLSPEQRVRFANDPLNLLAVDGPTNGSKSDGDAATWLPPDRDYWCAYVTRQIEVKHKYSLWVTNAEKTSMVQVLREHC